MMCTFLHLTLEPYVFHKPNTNPFTYRLIKESVHQTNLIVIYGNRKTIQGSTPS